MTSIHLLKAAAVAACTMITLHLGAMDAVAGGKASKTGAGAKQRRSLTAAEIAQLNRTPPWKKSSSGSAAIQNVKAIKAHNNSAERAIYQNRRKEAPQSGGQRKRP